MNMVKKEILGILVGLCGLCCGAIGAPTVNHVYILTGQSNSLGAVKGSPASEEQLERYKSSGKLWNGNMKRDTGECFESSPEWVPVAPQLPDYNGGLCMGPEYGFCSMMERRGWRSGKSGQIYVIKASLDGGGNSCWLSDSPGYKSLLDTVKKALGALKGKVQVHGLLYLQGESDKGNEITEAPKRFLSLLSRLAKDSKQTALKRAVVGQCATWSDKETRQAGKTTAQLMEAMAGKNKNVGWVRTRDLPKITKGDSMGVHYNGTAQLAIGARYAYAAALLEKLPLPGAVRSDDPEAGLESAGAWLRGKGAGKEGAAEELFIWDLAAANGEDTLKGSISCSGIVVEDPIAGRVVVKAEEGKKARISISGEGIVLKEADLSLQCPVELTTDQTWKLEEGRKLTIGSPDKPVDLHGSCKVTIEAAPGASVKLYTTGETEKIEFVDEGGVVQRP